MITRKRGARQESLGIGVNSNRGPVPNTMSHGWCMMSDFISQAFVAPPERLARLLAASHGRDGEWFANELGAILRHQLRVAIRLPRDTSQALSSSNEIAPTASEPDIMTFYDLFKDPCPPLALLEQVKEFAKTNREHPDSALPQEISLVLYYASIVVAMVRLNRRITSLDETALYQGIEWVLGLPWLDDSLRPLFVQGLTMLHVTAREAKG